MKRNDERHGWAGSVKDFLSVNYSEWLFELSEHEKGLMNMNPARTQVSAWKNCFDILRQQLSVIDTGAAQDWSIVFEYELPRERGRRPDVVILTNSAILVLEFKDHHQIHRGFLDQTSAYARDLQHYHAESHQHPVKPVLVLTKAQQLKQYQDNVWATSPEILPEIINELTKLKSISTIDVNVWCNADYAPLPSLVAAARDIFNNEPLPQIRRAQSAGIPETIESLVSVANLALGHQEKHLALVTGVPGAGKTLVGLKFVYENYFKDQGSKRTAVLLSGNGPLVQVLQHALKSSIFVRDVHGYLLQYGGISTVIPEESIWVYDEAQRAWDEHRVRQKRREGNSEPKDFLLIGEKKSSALMVGLIGEGQEIHLGEEAGLKQWNEAIESMDSEWVVHCPSHIAHYFEGTTVDVNDTLNLDTSLRSHLAGDVHLWINKLLAGELSSASKIANLVEEQGFNMYISRSMDDIREYLEYRYLNQEEKRYGLVASSKAKNPSFQDKGIDNSWQATRRVKYGPWYNDPTSSEKSCCRLKEVVTEFGCQGLELDFPVIAWGDDLKWLNQQWVPKHQPRSKALNPDQLRINSYRVLLSRGRDGFVIYVPPEHPETFEALSQSGLRNLDDPVTKEYDFGGTREKTEEKKGMTYNIYVIELSKDVLEEKKFKKANPNYIEGKPCVYVGYTSKTPEERWEEHRKGARNKRGKLYNPFAKKYGLWLKPRQYKSHNPISTKEQAMAMEKEIARRLSKKGWGVWWN